MSGGKKFDVVLMNPPYDNNLHLKFLKKTIMIAENVINISPSDCFTNMNVQNKMAKELSNYIEDIEIINARTADKEFNIYSSSNLGIGLFKDNAKGFKPLFYEVEHIIKLLRKHKSIRSSINCNKKTDTSEYHIGVQGDYGYAKTWHYSLTEIFKGDPNARISFNTQNELENFVNSVKNCWPYKLMYVIDDNAAVIAHLPFMGDYTKPWTDERFYKSFNINENDKKIIKYFIETYYKEKE